jgi:hypothetical protein
MKGKISSADKKTISDKCNEFIQFVDSDAKIEKEEYESRLKEAKAVFDPTITYFYQSSSGQDGYSGTTPSDMGAQKSNNSPNI